MPDTLATCSTKTASAATSAAFFTELDDFFTNDAQVFTKNVSSTATRLLLDHPGGWQILIENDASILKFAIDPLGTIDVSVTPITGSAEWSGVETGWINSSTATTMHLAEYPDAILIAVKHSTSDYWQQAAHLGVVYSPYNASDAARYIDGFGIMVGIPTIGQTTAANNMILLENASNTNAGRIRIGQTTWSTDTLKTLPIVQNGDLSGNTRLLPFPVTLGSTSSTTALVSLGMTKYLRRYKTATTHLVTLPSVGASDQSFLIFSGNSSNSTSCCLWSKSTIP